MGRIPQYEPLINPNHAYAVARQIMSGWIGPGKATEEFEQNIRNITGAKHCLATTSGTTALIMAVKALELPQQCDIAFPAYTFIAGANAIRFCGHSVYLYDVKHETMCMNPDEVSHPAVMFVNHNGYVGPDVKAVRDKCDYMIEDSSQALGMPGAGRTGDMGVFSFSVPKIVTTGQGGAVITDSDMYYNRLRRIRDHGEDWRKDRVHNHLGVNFKFNDILASYGNEQLKTLHELLSQRLRVFSQYRSRIPLEDFGMPSTWMVIYRTPYADQVIADLAVEGVDAVRYYRPIHHNPPYRSDKSYPVAEEIYNEYVYLPSSLTLSNDQIDRICEIILAS